MNIIKNPFVQLITIIWFFACIACFAPGDNNPIKCAAYVTFISGVGYFCLQALRIKDGE